MPRPLHFQRYLQLAAAVLGLVSLSACANQTISHALNGKSIIVGASENDRFALHLITETDDVLSDTIFLKYWPGTTYWFDEKRPVFFEYHPMPFEMVGHWYGFQIRRFAGLGVPYQTIALTNIQAKQVQVISDQSFYVSDGYRIYLFDAALQTTKELYRSPDPIASFHIYNDSTLVYQLAPVLKETGSDPGYGTAIYRQDLNKTRDPEWLATSERVGFSDEFGLIVFKDQSGDVVLYDLAAEAYSVTGVNVHDTCLNFKFADRNHLMIQQEKGGVTKAVRWVLKLTSVLPADLTDFEIYAYDLTTKTRSFVAGGEAPVAGGVFYLVPGLRYQALP